MQNFKTEFNKYMETLRGICEEIKMKLKMWYLIQKTQEKNLISRMNQSENIIS